MDEPNVILASLKADLQISSSALDDFLNQLIDASKEFIKTEGIDLDLNNKGDIQLVVMYAAYLYRQRRDDGKYMTLKPLPRMLRWAMNNRLIQQKGTENG